MADEILPRLWIGDINSAHDLTFLKENGINCIINCTTSLPFSKHPSQKHRLSIKDNLQPEEIEKMFQSLDRAADLIHRYRTTMHVLVHCHMGKQRSVSVVLGYLIKYGKMTLKESVGYLLTKRQCALTPGFNFIEALRKYEAQIVPKSLPRREASVWLSKPRN